MTRRGLGALGVLAIILVVAASWRVLERSPAPAAPGAPAASGSSASEADSASAGGVSPDGAPIDPEITTIEGDGAFRLLVFPVELSGARFRVVDLDMRRALAPSVHELGATLVVNGGFFDPGSKPDGLVISEGKLVSPLRAELGGGVFLWSGERASIVAAEALSFDAGPVDFAIQCRPRLVVASARNVKGDGGPSAERTAICIRDHARSIEIVIARGEAAGAGPTLGLFADMLLSRGCDDALNLDGGPSTGVAWRSRTEGAILELPPRSGVRNGIAVWAKPEEDER